jgi:hypothetical protein
MKPEGSLIAIPMVLCTLALGLAMGSAVAFVCPILDRIARTLEAIALFPAREDQDIDAGRTLKPYDRFEQETAPDPTISRSKPATPEYREGWDKAFGNDEALKKDGDATPSVET